MAQARRRGTGHRSGRTPGWLLLGLGLAIGVTGTWLAETVVHRDFARGLWARSGGAPAGRARAGQPVGPANPKFDFYTILPETETVLPERASPRTRRATPSAPQAGVRYVLQAGAFATYAEADRHKARLALAGLVAHIQKVTVEGRGAFYRVRLGPFPRLDQLDAADRALRRLGINGLRLKIRTAAIGAAARAQSSR